jgi:hypothetical protein
VVADLGLTMEEVRNYRIPRDRTSCPVTRVQADLQELDRGIELRIIGSNHRFASTGVGDVKALRGLHPPEFRLRVGDWRVRFHDHAD